MSSVFRQDCTRPIPEGAERVTVKDKNGNLVSGVRFKGRDGKLITAPLTEKGDRCRVPSRKWYGEYKDADDIVQRVPLSENKRVAEELLADLVVKAAKGKAGIRDPYEKHKKTPLADHLAEFRSFLSRKGNTEDYIDLVLGRLEAVIAGCEWRTLNDLSASQAAKWLDEQRTSGRAGIELPVNQTAFTPGETAKLLGVSTAAVRDAVKRHQLEATGQGKARRFPRATVEALLDRRGQGSSAQTRNYYRKHLRAFGNWLVMKDRIAKNPFKKEELEAEQTSTDRRHDRRELTAEELALVLSSARNSTRSFRGLAGQDRFHLYATACGTGFRASALASLTPESFDLEDAVPTVTLAARKNKNRKTKTQPLPPDIADLLRDYLKDKPAGRPIWHGTGTWAKDHRGAEMLRGDLEVAGIPYAVEGPDGLLYADFHALRHSYLTLGGRAGIDLRTLQELAGHSTPNLTAKYSHRRLHDLAGAVEKLPSFLPTQGPETAQLQATDGAHPGGPDPLQVPYRPLTGTHDREGVVLRFPDEEREGASENTAGRKSLSEKGFAASCERLSAGDSSEGDGTRTRNHRIDSPVL